MRWSKGLAPTHRKDASMGCREWSGRRCDALADAESEGFCGENGVWRQTAGRVGAASLLQEQRRGHGRLGEE